MTVTIIMYHIPFQFAKSYWEYLKTFHFFGDCFISIIKKEDFVQTFATSKAEAAEAMYIFCDHQILCGFKSVSPPNWTLCPSSMVERLVIDNFYHHQVLNSRNYSRKLVKSHMRKYWRLVSHGETQVSKKGHVRDFHLLGYQIIQKLSYRTEALRYTSVIT